MQQSAERTGKTLLCIVGCRAERPAAELLLRLPDDVWDPGLFDILFSDDAASGAVDLVRRYRGKTRAENLKILKVFRNQGHGGNQKICFRYAVDRGYDRVLLVQGDALRDPAALSVFGRHGIESTSAVVLGRTVRRRPRAAALTALLNRLTGQRLGDWTAGCRCYRVDFLRSVPFELNSDNELFDLEILLQAVHVNAPLSEFALPPPGEAAAPPPDFRFFWSALLAAIRFAMQGIGIFTSLKYPRMLNRLYQAKFNDPWSTHSRVLKKLAAKKPSQVLDIGCGPGWLGKKIRESGAEITGVDLYQPEENVYNRFIACDIEREPVSINGYDAVLMLDILEHLASPETFLIGVRNTLGTGSLPEIHISVPNVGFAAVRVNLLFGRFNYGERGIIDTTHKRFFTRATVRRTLNEAGYDVLRLQGVGVPVMAQGFFFRAVSLLSHAAAAVWPSLFAFQFLVIARPRYTVRQIIELSELL